jgi:hypothetical protein
LRRSRISMLGILLLASPLLGADAKDCLDLAAKIDHDISSPSGVRVSITGRNHCQEDIDSRELPFKVKVLAPGNAVVGTQRGRFGGMVAPGGVVETKVFVECDPDRARSVTVEASSP